MTEIERLVIERACERLVLDFVDANDRQEYPALVALFTPKGTITRPSGGALIGHAAILESYQSRSDAYITRHICTNIRITVESEDRARGLTYALVYSAVARRPPEAHFGIKAEPRHLIGEFEDVFVRTPEGWRFSARRARFVMHT